MPTILGNEYHNDSQRIAAWKSHYVRKGCHPVKAAKVAWLKCKNSYTWPKVTSS